MFKSTIFSYLILTGFCAQLALAQTASQAAGLEKEVLKLLMKEAETITLIDSVDGEKLAEENQLSSLFISHLSEIPKINYSGSVVLSEVSISCKIAPKAKVGSQNYICKLSFSNGDYTTKNTSVDVEAATSESGIIIDVPVSKSVTPQAKPILKSKTLKALLAG